MPTGGKSSPFTVRHGNVLVYCRDEDALRAALRALQEVSPTAQDTPSCPQHAAEIGPCTGLAQYESLRSIGPISETKAALRSRVHAKLASAVNQLSKARLAVAHPSPDLLPSVLAALSGDGPALADTPLQRQHAEPVCFAIDEGELPIESEYDIDFSGVLGQRAEDWRFLPAPSWAALHAKFAIPPVTVFQTTYEHKGNDINLDVELRKLNKNKKLFKRLRDGVVASTLLQFLPTSGDGAADLREKLKKQTDMLIRLVAASSYPLRKSELGHMISKNIMPMKMCEDPPLAEPARAPAGGSRRGCGDA